MNHLLLGLLQTFLQLPDGEVEGASVFAISLVNDRFTTRKSQSSPKETPELGEGSVEGTELATTVPTSQSRGT